MLPVQRDNEVTMSSSQFAELLGYTKIQINQKIKAMFPEEIAKGEISSVVGTDEEVSEYYLPEVESQMFVSVENKEHLRTACTQFVGDNFPVNAAELARAWADDYEQKQLAQQK